MAGQLRVDELTNEAGTAVRLGLVFSYNCTV